MNILVIGDVVGRPGRGVIKNLLPRLQRDKNIDFTICNAENAAGGRGLTNDVKDELLGTGIDVLTMGNHVWDNKNIFTFIDDEPRLIRPANYPGPCPGKVIISIKRDSIRMSRSSMFPAACSCLPWTVPFRRSVTY